jgi:transcriptional regulator with GAF, ATPase, and Fis domain
MNSKFSQIWLETCCKLIPGVHSAIFVLPDSSNNQMKLMAKWPADLEQHDDLLAIIKYTLKKREPVCMPSAQVIDKQDYDFFALPVPAQTDLPGVIAIRVKHLPESQQKTVFSSLKRSIKWLRLANANQNQDDGFYSDVVSLLASCFEQVSYHEGLLRMVAELTRRFKCERVAFAEYRHHHCHLTALSNSAEFDHRSNLMQMIADAMDEAVEQDNVILFPDPKAKLIQRAHQELARKFGSGSLCTIPLIHGDKVFGAITLLSSE